MSDFKRFLIKVYDRKTGKEYELEGDSLSRENSRGLEKISDSSGKLLDLAPNGRLKAQLKLWSGFEEWEEKIHTEKKV